MYILSVGLNHKTAPIEIREKLVFQTSAAELALSTLNKEKSILENVIISTCNRTEIFAVVDQLHTARYYMKRFLAEWFQEDMDTLANYLFFYEEKQAVKHLFEVAAGLDSLVLGETQILGQVKQAFQLAQSVGTTGTLLNQLFPEAIRFAKKTHHDTRINENAVSVSYAAVEVAKSIHTNLDKQSVLLLGAGKMSELALKNLTGSGVQNVTIMNRTEQTGFELARHFHASFSPMQKLQVEMEQADIIIVSTGANEFVITESMAKNVVLKRSKPLLIIDIALPRNVEPACAQLANVFLYDLDDLDGIISANTEERKQIVKALEFEIEAETAAFFEWEKQLGVVPLIRELREKALCIQSETMKSLENKLPGLTEREYVLIGKHMKSIINQLLKNPVSEIKEMSIDADSEMKIQLFKEIFGLQVAESSQNAKEMRKTYET
ncbi:glutamyl-tRNA reductase [Listeria sp. ILCC792]|uniref:glutamyl-tRNA reductase n=1 Tax=Listeria sp. ILCC792 TaxID=1918331 RepID=UPI000B596957|nr:glutamyl-tRNA reductase [Listeria sp. ILCC792]